MKIMVVRIGAVVLGLIAFVTGAKMMWQGVEVKLGEKASVVLDPQLLASIDNDFRFLAAVWFIIGVGLIVGSLLIYKKPDLIQIGLEAIFLGGLARCYSMYEHGASPEFYPAIAIELLVPPFLFALLKLSKKELALQ